ncbi:MAG: hypothetical protein IKP40_11165 [Clostridia bacterium]|nr:hypothetical protein [Clostridia bacterium]
MSANRSIWAEARNRLASAVVSLGYPGELADLLARQIGSPRAMDRMTSYLYTVRPATMEMIADEMLAICAETETWRHKKEGQNAQAGYNAWLNSETRWRNLDEAEEG